MSDEPENAKAKTGRLFRFSIFNLLCLMAAVSFGVIAIVREVEHRKQVQLLKGQIQELESSSVEELQEMNRRLVKQISKQFKEKSDAAAKQSESNE